MRMRKIDHARFLFAPWNLPVARSVTRAFRSRQLRTDPKVCKHKCHRRSLPSRPSVPYTPRICPFRRTNFVLTAWNRQTETLDPDPLLQITGLWERDPPWTERKARDAHSLPTHVLQSERNRHASPDRILEQSRQPRPLRQTSSAPNLERRGEELAGILPGLIETHFTLDWADAWCTCCWLQQGNCAVNGQVGSHFCWIIA